MKNKDSEKSTGDCKIKNIGLADLTVHPVAANILWYLERNKRMTSSGLAKILSFKRVPPRTIKYHLRALVLRGYAQRHGRGKGTWYTL